MAKQSILWTALPFGRVSEGPHAGSLRLSIVVSPRLTPQNAAEQKLGAAGFADFHNWPETLDKVKLGLRIGNQTVPVKRISQTDPQLWKQIFGADTPVAVHIDAEQRATLEQGRVERQRGDRARSEADHEMPSAPGD
mgnify:CR=1 FL=1